MAKLVRASARREKTIGPADDVFKADGKLALSYAQAQELARAWFPRADRENANEEEPGGPYTVILAVDDYLADYRRRGGKALRNTEIVADAFIRPRLGDKAVAGLTAKAIGAWHADLAAAAPRLRAAPGVPSRVRELDATDPEMVRRRRATANRVLTVLKAALNHGFREGKIDFGRGVAPGQAVPRGGCAEDPIYRPGRGAPARQRHRSDVQTAGSGGFADRRPVRRDRRLPRR